ncbi:hypothetical protein [Halobacteriovorax sp.]|uniref:hypothetical protein n=1 Tax=Halobacteriovorax sp. TaxID=2020862 RepID=UPI003AF2810A
MKSLVLTSVLCSGVCQATPVNKVVKVMDGNLSRCTSKQDVFRNKLQSYRVKSYKAQQHSGSVELTINIQMLECKETDKGFAFKEKNIFDLFSYKTFKNEDVSVVTKSANLHFYKDGSYKSLSKVAIKDYSKESSITVNFDIQDLLTKEELRKYLDGEAVTTSFDFNLNRKVEVSNDEISDEFNQSYGGFRIFLEVK